MCSDHRGDGDEDARPPVDDAGYTELRNIGADNAAHLYSELDSVPTRNKSYTNARR